MRRYAINSVYNMRDLGGYPTEDGFSTKYGVIIRSDCPMSFHKNDIEQLEALNIRTVIDFRTQEEIEKRPCYFSKLAQVSYRNISFLAGSENPKEEAEVSSGYFNMMEDASAIRQILGVIAESDGNVLIHCAVGKDRTGVVSALLLKLCGVQDQDIIADYQVSHTYLKKFIDGLRKENPHWPSWVGTSKPEYMQEALEMLNAKYGSFDSYLNEIDVPSEVRHKIAIKMKGI